MMRDYAEQVNELRDFAEEFDLEDYIETAIMLANAADTIEELLAAVPHWISVDERLPEEPYGCLLVVWDSPQNGGDDFLNYLPYFAGWDGEQWNDEDGMQVPFEVAYWMPLPDAPKEDAE